MGWVLQSTSESGSFNIVYALLTSKGTWSRKNGVLYDNPVDVANSGTAIVKFTVRGAFRAWLEADCDGSFTAYCGAAYLWQTAYRELPTENGGNPTIAEGTDVSMPETTYVFLCEWDAVNSYGPGYLNLDFCVEGKFEAWVWEDDDEEEDDEEEEDEETVENRITVNTPTKTVEKTVTTSADGLTVDTVTVTTEITTIGIGGVYWGEVPIATVWKTADIGNITNCNGGTATETTTVTTVTERTVYDSDGNATTSSDTTVAINNKAVEADYIL